MVKLELLLLTGLAALASARPRRSSLFEAVSPKRRAAVRSVADVHDLGDTLDRYALALAATEPLREARDAALRSTLGKGRFFWLTGVRKRNACDPRCRSAWRAGVRSLVRTGEFLIFCDNFLRALRRSDGPWRGACAVYAASSSRVLDAFGFTPAEWNALSRSVAADGRLRRRVVAQAELYALASTLDARRDAGVGCDGVGVAPLRVGASYGDDLERFAAVAQRVEGLRQKQRADLVASLGLAGFPAVPICDSELLPLMSKEVRDTCADFPKEAARLVKSEGLEFDTFKALLEKAEKNRLFRWKLARVVRRMKKDRSRA